MTPLTHGYSHESEWVQGYEDARNGYPRRLSQTAPYRQGYDKGLTASCNELYPVDMRPVVDGKRYLPAYLGV